MSDTGKRKQRELKSARIEVAVSETQKADITEYALKSSLSVTDIIIEGASLFRHGRVKVLGRLPQFGSLQAAAALSLYHEFAPRFLRPRAEQGDCFLEIHGDDMAPTLVGGDLLLLSPGRDYAQGEICAVRLTSEAEDERGDGATEGEAAVEFLGLRRLYRLPDHHLALVADDPAHITMTVPAVRVEVLGVGRAVLRPRLETRPQRPEVV